MPVTGSTICLYFRCADIAFGVAELTKRGVVFGSASDRAQGRSRSLDGALRRSRRSYAGAYAGSAERLCSARLTDSVEGERMDQDTSLFVQAFWVKCREVIRPEVDSAISDVRRAGHDGHVSTQEYTTAADGLPAHAGPSLTLALRPANARDGDAHPSLEFHGDVAGQAVDILTSDGRKTSYDIAVLDAVQVRAELDDWLGRLVVSAA
jgi:hypothetical protein